LCFLGLPSSSSSARVFPSVLMLNTRYPVCAEGPAAGVDGLLPSDRDQR
jgi:hypothetical protein